MMKMIVKSVILLFFICLQYQAFAQDDEVYYNQKSRKSIKMPAEYPFHFFTDLVRPFYRDVNFNAEAALFSSFSISAGYGIYLPGKYTYISLDEPKLSFSTDKSGFRIVSRIRHYLFQDSYCDGPFSGFAISYSALPGLRYRELILHMGSVFKLYHNITLSVELGLSTTKYYENIHQVYDNWLNAGFFANLSVGYRFKNKKTLTQ